MDPASFGRRAIALLIDFLLLTVPAGFLVGIGVGSLINDESSGGAAIFILLGGAWSVAFGVWNKIIREGKTGQSLGRHTLRIALVGATTGQPIGAGKVFVRELLTWILSTVSGGLFGIVDYLFPLWDSRNQRLIDKIVDTVVVDRR